MSQFIPYTYLVGWSELDLYYYGTEYGSKTKTANPQNLWTSYFTSSKEVSKLREAYGEPDIIEVRKTFDNADDAIRWENRVLHRLDVLNNPKWINSNVGGHIGVLSEEIQKKKGEKVSATKRKRKHTAWNKGLTKDDPRVAKYASKIKGVPKSEEVKEKFRQAKLGNTYAIGVVRSKETKEKIRQAAKKQFASEESRKESSDRAKASRRCCVYCGVEFQKSRTTRHERYLCDERPT